MKERIRRVFSLVLALVMIATITPLTASAEGEQTKLVAITFDDGPSQYTSHLLDILAEKGAKATFFMNGSNGGNGTAHYTSALSRMVQDGHQLANHTYSHASLPSLSYGGVQSEVSKVREYLNNAMGGPYTSCVRPPYGSVNDSVAEACASPIILWSVDPEDWRYRNTDTVVNNIMSLVSDGSIILLHDMYSTSVDAAEIVIGKLQAEGYEFVTVAELFRRRNITLQNGSRYSSAPNKGTTLGAYPAPEVSTSLASDGRSLKVTMTSAEGLDIYYTTDGSLPTLGSQKYTGELTVSTTAQYRVAGYDKYGTRTEITEKQVDSGCAQPPTAMLSSDGFLSLSSETPGARIYYSTGNGRGEKNYREYKEPFRPGDLTYAYAAKDGLKDSAEQSFSLIGGRYFSDISSDSWYYQSVARAVKAGWMSGTGKQKFSPDDSLTRAMLVTILYRLDGSGYNAGKQIFSDVKPSAWYGDAVAWADENDIVNGVGGNKFSPNSIVTREQTASILKRYATYKGLDYNSSRSLAESFSDYDSISSYAMDAVSWAYDTGLLKGVGGGSFSPGAGTTRAQAAVVLSRLDDMTSPSAYSLRKTQEFRLFIRRVMIRPA